MTTRRRDLSIDSLLDLNGQTLVVDDAGYWVKFVVYRVPVVADKPHGLDYSLTLHGPDGVRLVGFDNAHAVHRRKRAIGNANDHRHRLRTIKAYDYTDAGALVAAFWQEVESVMREKGIWK